jgi:biopolymer transport protein ExbD
LANWDVFHGDRLELERDLTTSAVREALARGELLDDDLVRPAGMTVAWTRLGDLAELLEPSEPPPIPAASAPAAGISPPLPASDAAAAPREPSDFELDSDEIASRESLPAAQQATLRAREWVPMPAEHSDIAFPVFNDEPVEPKPVPAGSKIAPEQPASPWHWAEEVDDGDLEEEDNDFIQRPQDVEAPEAKFVGVGEDEPASFADGLEIVEDSSSSFALPVSMSSGTLPVVGSGGPMEDQGALVEVPEPDEFSLSRSGPTTVEELDLAPMVDVAFQLVLFFMVAAQTVLYKTLEIPKPSTDQTPAAVTQGRSRNLDDLQDDYILVEIDSSGAMKIDRQSVPADMAVVVDRLRSAREATRRKAMLLSADFATPHRSAVLAYDAANEIGLGIVIARPAPPQGPAPRLHEGQLPSTGTSQPATKAPATNSAPF